jgi:hypothetical protein
VAAVERGMDVASIFISGCVNSKYEGIIPLSSLYACGDGSRRFPVCVTMNTLPVVEIVSGAAEL